MTILQKSSQPLFQTTLLTPSVAICEAIGGDSHNWGNATETDPAFIAYVGCHQDEVESYLKTFNTFYRCCLCEVRKPKHLKGFSAEIKIRGMQRYSDSNAFGLDYLVESEATKHLGADFDSYNYYSTGTVQHW